MGENVKTMNITDFAARWGIGRDAMRKEIKNSHDFPAIKVGKKTLVITEEADSWVRKHFRA